MSTAIACDGSFTTSASAYDPQSALRLGDSLAQFSAFPGCWRLYDSLPTCLYSLQTAITGL